MVGNGFGGFSRVVLESVTILASYVVFPYRSVLVSDNFLRGVVVSLLFG